MKSAETERSDRGCCVFTNPYPFKNETTLEETDPYFQSVLLTPYETYMKQKRATSGESSNALNWMQIFILVQVRGLAAQSSCSTPPQIHTVSNRHTPEETTRTQHWSAGDVPSQEALGERGELAFPILNEVSLGHEVVELLPLL